MKVYLKHWSNKLLPMGLAEGTQILSDEQILDIYREGYQLKLLHTEAIENLLWVNESDFTQK